MLCDYERGRTRPGWRPVRLGGGRNESRLSEEEKAKLLEENRQRHLEQHDQEQDRDRDRDLDRGRDF